ncbi:fasciclin domain-containing protein [Hymenobacter psychrophilus]|uniref:Uncaracterized surface protein containing fasciclin (FAS1) repeats n=1 Tax=Hymenobacter psychrophilus TaxID=651662 RepID=A0A1H3J1Q4_9BACT|nr:Uncaracterized surface protein containing fasciclin (FAS1) repeats [Hymenobacter psychrophilus]
MVALASVTLLTSCDDDDDNNVIPAQNIVQVAQGDARFSTLVAAVTKADLGTTLAGTGPFTVFAPTNDAFAKLGSPFNSAASITAITDPAQIATLKDILLYHVVAGDIKAADISTGASSQKTARPASSAIVNDNTIYLTKNANGVFINGLTKVVVADVDASNGTIHAIDNVLMPPTQSITEILAGFNTGPTPEFSLLLQALSRPAAASILAAAADPAANITVFAPTDAAFRTLLSGAALSSVSDANLVAILSRHVITTGRVFSSDLAAGQIATAAGANTVTVAASGTGFTVRGGTGTAANITNANILADNGLVHIIDQVLLP